LLYTVILYIYYVVLHIIYFYILYMQPTARVALPLDTLAAPLAVL